MKIIIYSSCYGKIFCNLLKINSDVQIYCFEWYKNVNFDINIAKDYDIMIIENVSKDICMKTRKKNGDTHYSDYIIEKIKEINENIIIIQFQMIRMYINEFYEGVVIAESYTINKLLKNFNKNEILHLYDNNEIKWNCKKSFDYSLEQLKIVEKSNNKNINHNIPIVDFILDNYKTNDIFIDRVFPEEIIVRYLYKTICEYIKLYHYIIINNDSDIKNFIINNEIYKWHYNNKCITQYMIDELELKYDATPNWKNIMRNKLVRYLKFK